MENNIKVSIINDEISDNILESIKYCLKNKLKYLELRTLNKTNLLDLNHKKLKQTKKMLDENGIKVSCIASPLFKWYKTNLKEKGKRDRTYSFSFPEKLTSSEKKYFIKKTIEIAKIFQTKYIRIFSIYRDNQTIDNFWEIEKDLFNYLFSLANSNNLELLVENGYDVNFHSSKQVITFKKIFKKTPIKLLLDIANTYVIKDPIKKKDYKLIIPNIEYLHLKDFSLKKNKIDILGQGDIDYEYFFKLLFKYIQKPIYVSLEPENYNQNIEIVNENLTYLNQIIKRNNEK